ncbi:MAG: acetolactate synthase-1/2/3 large subunit [Gammaproteobacteria bacterium]
MLTPWPRIFKQRGNAQNKDIDMRGADLLVQTLAAAGVRKIFSLSGNQIMPIYDACVDADIEIIHTRHEGAAVFMADAYAQLTGQVGVCLVTAAPGTANAVGPLYTARQSESPIVLLTGDSPLAQDGKGAFQELDQIPITKPLTKLSFRAKSAKGLGVDIARAMRTAQSGRPGPVHVALPFDVLEGDATGNAVPNPLVWARESMALQKADAQRIVQTLAAAQAPLVVVGPAMNATRCAGALRELADALDAPVVAMESPRGLKDPALGDFAQALAKADVVLSLGKPVNYTLGFGGAAACSPSCRWIVVDADAAERDRAHLNLGDRLSICVAADPRDALPVLIDAAAAGGSARSAWRSEVTDRIAARSYTTNDSTANGKITPAALCAAVQRQIAALAESVVISDGGEFGQWSQAVTSGTHRVINGPGGAIGGGLCYAIAAKKAKPDAAVFALMGDGTVGFHFAEFETAARENTAFVVVIGNDECWNAEHQIQLREYGADRLIGCQLSAARYDQAAEALGGHGEYVTELGELDAALLRAIESGKVACVNVAMQGVPAPSGSAH